MFGGGGRRGPVDTSLYEILQVQPDASQSDIKKSYFKLAKEYHPDKNPEHGDRFKEISFAYEVLSDPQKRQIYDARGIDGIKEGGGGGGGFPGGGSFFSHFFGGGGDDDDDDEMGGHPFSSFFGGMRSQPRQRKFRDTVHPLHVSLEELYTGKTSKLKVTRKVLCKLCKGSGGEAGKKYTCDKCRGRGVRTITQQVGPGILQQMQVPCNVCEGSGGNVPNSEKCKTCDGAQFQQEQKIIEAHVRPGMAHGDKLLFQREGDQVDPSAEPGDIVIVIQQKEHDLFERRGDDLHMKKSITLNEALCGFQYLVNFVDGNRIIIKGQPGEIVRPGTTKGVLGKGMPNKKYPELKGNLVVEFDVVFPKQHFLENESAYKVLESLLPSSKAVPVRNGATEVSTMEYDEKKYNRSRGGDAYNEDSEEEREPSGGARCQQQ